jgi:hypothetical protein
MRHLPKLFLMLCLTMAGAGAAFAQQDSSATTGSIGGTVTDVNGGAVAGATVTVTGQTGTRTVTTNDEGVYEVKGLIPGLYSVKIEAGGFKSAQAQNVEVLVTDRKSVV